MSKIQKMYEKNYREIETQLSIQSKIDFLHVYDVDSRVWLNSQTNCRWSLIALTNICYTFKNVKYWECTHKKREQRNVTHIKKIWI